MNTTTNLERRVLLTAWLMQRAALLLLLLAPARAAATYVDHTSNYMVTPAGAGEIKFKMPVYDKDGDDCWVYEARLYYQVEGSDTKTEVFYLFIGDDDKWGDIPDSRPTLECDITNMGGGTLTIDPVVNGKNDRDPHSITIGTETVHCCVYNQGDQFYLNGVWIVPLEMRGKTVTFT